MSKLENLLKKITGEVERAATKYPRWPTDPLHALAVLGEEFGELTKATLQLSYEPYKTSRADVRSEAIQTAAMAIRFALSLDAYEFCPGDQHPQEVGQPSLNAKLPAGKIANQVYEQVAKELSKAMPLTDEPGQTGKVIFEPDRMAALVLLGEKAATAALLRKKERENESHKDSGPLEYEAEGAEADLIRAAQEYFEQFPEVPPCE